MTTKQEVEVRSAEHVCGVCNGPDGLHATWCSEFVWTDRRPAEVPAKPAAIAAAPPDNRSSLERAIEIVDRLAFTLSGLCRKQISIGGTSFAETFGDLAMVGREAMVLLDQHQKDLMTVRQLLDGRTRVESTEPDRRCRGDRRKLVHSERACCVEQCHHFADEHSGRCQCHGEEAVRHG